MYMSTAFLDLIHMNPGRRNTHMYCIKKYPVYCLIDGFAICQIQKPLLESSFKMICFG